MTADRRIEELEAEILRLIDCLKWEQHRSGRADTHGENCHLWGPQHYECLLRKFNEITKVSKS
jgi:hypothetical protein